jgi:hypothetical protein
MWAVCGPIVIQMSSRAGTGLGLGDIGVLQLDSRLC